METKLESLKNTPETSPPERDGRVVSIHKPEGDYTIVYGFHNATGSSKPMDPNDIPSNLSGLFLETGARSPWIKDPLGTLEGARRFEQYASIFPKAEALKVPIIFGDPNLQWGKAAIADLIPGIAESAIGAGLLSEIAQKVKGDKLKRRDLLKGAAATWLLSTVLSDVAVSIASVSGTGEDLSAKFKKASTELHPEIYLFLEKLRNVLIAHKEEWLMKQQNSQQHITTLIGAGHVGLEDQIISSPDERIDFLKKLKPFLNEVIDDPATFYSIATFKYDSDEHRWREDNLYEVPELKELLK